ncbi:MAG: hypothetical protein O7G84_19365 [Gammaproteobacteria bacterium]|nr:hypothetical protein [Gammaproteobacteria bacterium]
MGIRISTTLDLTAGFNNDLKNKAFGGNGVISQVLDTLQDSQSGTYTILGGATESIDFGDITTARYIYIEGDAEFSVAFAATLATSGLIAGAAGSYPTGLTGGEVLELEIDTIPITVTFTSADQTRDQVIARINFEAALANEIFVADPIAFQNGTELDLKSNTTGPASIVEVLAASTAAVLTALGLSVGVNTGSAAEPGTTNVQVLRPADPAGSSAAEGLQAYLLGTIEATAIQVTNLSATAALDLTVFLAGDLVATP